MKLAPSDAAAYVFALSLAAASLAFAGYTITGQRNLLGWGAPIAVAARDARDLCSGANRESAGPATGPALHAECVRLSWPVTARDNP